MNPIQFFAYGKSRFDIDALAFITATGITNTTQKDAINTLTKGLKSAGLWTKIKAIYPFIGGTSTTHKYNLKDPRDLDAAFRLAFGASVVHNSSGVTTNGTVNTLISTFLVPSTSLSATSSNLSVYSRTDTVQFAGDIGCQNSSTQRMSIEIKSSAGGGTVDFYNPTTNRLTFVMTGVSSTGLFMGNRTGSTVLNSWRNGVKLSTSATALASSIPTTMVLIGTAGTGSYCIRNYAFATIGDGLTDTEAADLYTLIQSFQTTLGRQV